MGAHHYYLQVIPKKFIEKHKNDLANILKEQQAWEKELPSPEFLEELRSLL